MLDIYPMYTQALCHFHLRHGVPAMALGVRHYLSTSVIRARERGQAEEEIGCLLEAATVELLNARKCEDHVGNCCDKDYYSVYDWTWCNKEDMAEREWKEAKNLLRNISLSEWTEANYLVGSGSPRPSSPPSHRSLRPSQFLRPSRSLAIFSAMASPPGHPPPDPIQQLDQLPNRGREIKVRLLGHQIVWEISSLYARLTLVCSAS